MALKAQDARFGAPPPEDPGPASRSLSEWIYTTEWVPLPHRTEQRESAGSAVPATWVLLPSASTLNLSARWAEELRKQGSRVQEIQPAPEGLSPAEGLVAGGERREIVVFAGGESAEEQVGTALELMQRLPQPGPPTRVRFVSQLPIEGRLSLAAAALRGFSRSLGLERPDLAPVWLALDPHGAPAAALGALARAEDEDVLWLQGDALLVPRLRRKVLGGGGRPALRPESSYLVTGAFGRLGEGIIDWLAGCGARQVVLIGRNPPTAAEEDWARRRERWEAQGLQLRVEACDVADEAAVRQLLTRVAEEGAPVAGVVHAAAGVQFAPVAELQKADVVTAFRAKVEGARVLDRCTREMQLDLFILFGSASAKVGLRDGTLYAAANSCLEALARERRGLGLPATCVEWGLWKAGTAELAGASTQLGRIESSGFRAMENIGAFAALDAILGAGDCSAVIADIDWSVLVPALRSLHREGLADEMLPPALQGGTLKAQQQVIGSPWLESIRNLSPEERYSQLHELVTEKVAEICGLPSTSALDDTTGFFDLGMDSLMGIELQTYLEDCAGIRMQGTLTLNYPNVAVLTDFLEETLFPSAARSEPVKETFVSSSGAKSLAALEEAAVEAMSDDEVQLALRAELEAIERPGERSS